MPLTAEAKAVDGKDALDVGLFIMQIVVGNGIQHFLRSLLRSAGRQLEHGHKHALIFIRQEGGWQTHKEHGHPHDDEQIDSQVASGTAKDPADAVGVVVNAAVEPGVEPTEKAFLFIMVGGRRL